LWDKQISPFLGQLSDIHLVGIGEPLLCKDFFYFVEDSLKYNVRVHTTSNLQLINENIAEKLVHSGIKVLSFSCDGISRDTYDKIRVNGKFDTLNKSLNMINKYKVKHRSASPSLILNFGAMKCNIHELPAVVEFAKEHSVENIIAYHNVIYVPELKDESLYHHQALSDQKFIEAKQLADRLGITLFLPGLFSHPIKYKTQGIYCNYPYSHLYIYSDGRVGPCCMDFPDRYLLGNIRASSLEKVWNDAPIAQLRNELAKFPSDTCRYCVSHGKMDISDPNYFFRFKGSDAYIKGLMKKRNCCRV
jgi:radical SAM protein with 4Fe4S-binding SPASM domain